MSVCPTCGLPSEICVCEEIAVSETTLKINTERRSFGKYVTIVHGVKDAKIDVKKLAKMLIYSTKYIFTFHFIDKMRF